MYARKHIATATDSQQPADDQIGTAVEMLRMLAEPTRLRILFLLTETEHNVTDLTAAVDAARPAVSQHLAKLRLAGLVTERREGRSVIYAAKGGHVRRLVIEALSAADHQINGTPEHD